MTTTQITHLEHVLASKEIEIKELQKKLCFTDNLSKKRSNEISELKKHIDSMKLTMMFFEGQIMDAKDLLMKERAEHALLKQKFKESKLS